MRCAKCFTFALFNCHNNPSVAKFYYSHFTNEEIEVQRELASNQGHRLVKRLDWDSTPGHSRSKFRHLKATQLLFAGTNAPNENNALRILQIPTRFKGTGGKVEHTERAKMVAVLKDITIQ